MPSAELLDPSTEFGPLIAEHEAERVTRWVSEAAEGGARVLTGGVKDGPHAACDQVSLERKVTDSEIIVERRTLFADVAAAIRILLQRAKELRQKKNSSAEEIILFF